MPLAGSVLMERYGVMTLCHFRGTAVRAECAPGRPEMGLTQFLDRAPTSWLYGVLGIGAWVFAFVLVPETKGRSPRKYRGSLASEGIHGLVSGR